VKPGIRVKKHAQPEVVVLPDPPVGETRQGAAVGTELCEAFQAQSARNLLEPDFSAASGALRIANDQVLPGRRSVSSRRGARTADSSEQKENAALEPGGGAAFFW
jgi:hypothetical protein